MAFDLPARLENLNSQAPLPPERVAFLLTFPMEAKAFEAARLQPGRFQRMLGHKSRDLIPNQLFFYEDWPTYFHNLGAALWETVQRLKNSRPAHLIVHADYKTFRQCMRAEAFSLVVLAAHHVTGEQAAIEFADGCEPLENVMAFLKELQRPEKVSLINIVCNSQPLELELHGKAPAIQSVATASWEVPIAAGVDFAACWLAELDGRKTLLDAYHQARNRWMEEKLE